MRYRIELSNGLIPVEFYNRSVVAKSADKTPRGQMIIEPELRDVTPIGLILQPARIDVQSSTAETIVKSRRDDMIIELELQKRSPDWRDFWLV